MLHRVATLYDVDASRPNEFHDKRAAKKGTQINIVYFISVMQVERVHRVSKEHNELLSLVDGVGGPIQFILFKHGRDYLEFKL